MNTPQIYYLNAMRFDSLEGFYDTIFKLMPFLPVWKPAHNLDALHDLLYTSFGKKPVVCIWEYSEKSKSDLGREATYAFYQKKIDQGKPFNVKWAKQQQEDLVNGPGQTLFEIILEVFSQHDQIQLVLV